MALLAILTMFDLVCFIFNEEKNSLTASCHPERSEGSSPAAIEKILRFAQDDMCVVAHPLTTRLSAVAVKKVLQNDILV